MNTCKWLLLILKCYSVMFWWARISISLRYFQPKSSKFTNEGNMQGQSSCIIFFKNTCIFLISINVFLVSIYFWKYMNKFQRSIWYILTCLYFSKKHACTSDILLLLTCIYFCWYSNISNMHIFLTCIYVLHITCIYVMHNIWIKMHNTYMHFFWYAYIFENAWIYKQYMNKLLIWILLLISNHSFFLII